MDDNELPEGWTEVSLDVVVDILDNRRDPINAETREKRLEGSDQKYPYYGATGQVGWIDDYLFDEELVLLGEDGAPFLEPFRKVAYTISGKAWVNNHAHVLRAREGIITTSYLKYYLNEIDYRDFVSGSTRLKLTQGRMKEILVLLPPLSEQRRIADRLDAIQSRTQKTGETLDQVPDRIEEYRQSVLNAAFTGRLTADWRDDHPDVEPAEALLERILEERRRQWEKDYRAKYEKKGKEPPSGWKSRYSPPDSLDRDDLPEPPESWEWVSLDQLLSNLRNGYSKAPKAEDGLPVLRISAVRPMSVDLDDVRYLAEKPDDYHKYLIEPGYLLFIRYNGNENLVGVCGRVPEIDGEYLHPDKLIRGEVAAPDLTNPAFLEMALNTGDSRLHIRRRVRSTSGQSGISQDVLYSTPVPLPPEEEQKEIVRRVRQRLDKIDEMARHVEQARERLDHLDQSVLAKAFRGELVETEAERARREDRDYETAEELLARIQGEPTPPAEADTSESGESDPGEEAVEVNENGQFEMKVVKDGDVDL